MVYLIYFWLNTPKLAIDRFKERVLKGGHNIPLETIHRRYIKGISNLFKLFMNEVDIWMVYDNSNYKGERIAFGGKHLEKHINNEEKFNKIKKYVE